MPRFRARLVASSAPVGDPCPLLDDVLRPCHFYVGPGPSLTWHCDVEEHVPWEVFQGRLLPPGQTRQRRMFRSWNVVEQTATGLADLPLLSLKWDASRREIHVVRGLLCHVWQMDRAGGNVVEGRETTAWIPELVGTLTLDDFSDEEELRDELICRLWQAVVGTSRLPLTSLEAPLPAFVLGRLAYVYSAADPSPTIKPSPTRQRGFASIPLAGASGSDLSRREQVKLLEIALRAAPPDEIAEIAQRLIDLHVDVARLLRLLFNDVSLSPWTGLVNNALALVQTLVAMGEWLPGDALALLSTLLMKLSRHLTAYDLVMFHHRGANYPDALFLDALLKALLQWAEREPRLFLEELEGCSGSVARRALLHGVVLRRTYEGHAVPDAPTSPGENQRVLPAPYTRVPEEQLANPLRRERRLFADDPLVRLVTPSVKEILRRCLEDLCDIRAMMDLGRALFIDRPLGFGKTALEPDQTPLLAHDAYSQAIAARRLEILADTARDLGVELPLAWPSRRALEQAGLMEGTPISQCALLGRPVAALTDAQRASSDFVVLVTLPGSVRRLQELFRWERLEQRFGVGNFWHANTGLLVLRLPAARSGSVMVLREASSRDGRPRLIFEADPSRGFRSRGGVELPVAGLRIWLVRDDRAQEHDLRGEVVHVAPRW